MKTTAEERARWRNQSEHGFGGLEVVKLLLDDIDELLAERETLRDKMAMAVVGHYMHLCNDSLLRDEENRLEIPTITEYAFTAYQVADAMLIARREKGAERGTD